MSPLTESQRAMGLKTAEWFLQGSADYFLGVDEKKVRAASRLALHHLRQFHQAIDRPAPRTWGAAAVTAYHFLLELDLAENEGTGGPANLSEVWERLEELEALLARVDQIISGGVFAFARAPNESFALFAEGMAALYIEATGLEPTVRKDALGEHSSFVRFVHGVWKKLPDYNETSRDISSMNSRLAAHLRTGRKLSE